MRILVASLALAVTPIALADAEGHAPLGGFVPQGSRTPTLSEVSGFDIVPAPALVLPDEDHEAYLAQDSLERSGPKALRFAIPVPVAVDISMGQWIDVPGGRVWRLEVLANNALTARLHLTASTCRRARNCGSRTPASRTPWSARSRAPASSATAPPGAWRWRRTAR